MNDYNNDQHHNREDDVEPELHMAGYKIPLRSIIAGVTFIVLGALAWNDLRNAAAENADTNDKQDEAIGRIIEEAQDAEVQRARIEERQRQILDAIQGLQQDIRRSNGIPPAFPQ